MYQRLIAIINEKMKWLRKKLFKVYRIEKIKSFIQKPKRKKTEITFELILLKFVIFDSNLFQLFCLLYINIYP